MSLDCSNRLKIEPHRIQIGKFEIPTGEVVSARILQDNNTIRLWCRNGAMGWKGDVILDFRLQNVDKVDEFVRGILEKTRAYFFAIRMLKTNITGDLSTSSAMAKFHFYIEKDAKIFKDHIAPIYFDSSKTDLDEEVVTVFLEQGNRTDVIRKMKNIFAKLNIHTQNTLHKALYWQSLYSPFRESKVPKNSCFSNHIRQPDFNISPDQVILKLRKESNDFWANQEDPPPYFASHVEQPTYIITPQVVGIVDGDKNRKLSFKSLLYRKESMHQIIYLVKKVDGKLKQFVQTHPTLTQSMEKLLELFKTVITKEDLNSVDLAIFSNRLRGELDEISLVTVDLDPKTQEEFNQVIHGFYIKTSESTESKVEEICQ